MENTSADVQPRWKRSRVERASEPGEEEDRKSGGRERERVCVRCRKNGKPAFVEGEKERERVEGWLDEGGWDDRRWLGTERERRVEGEEGRRQRDWRVLDRQKTKVHRGKMAVD